MQLKRIDFDLESGQVSKSNTLYKKLYKKSIMNEDNLFCSVK